MSTDSDISKTVFYDHHLAAGGKMVPFAGYLMPVQYSSGIMQEHLHCRDNAGLFDVSHMGQIIVEGEGAAQALEKLMPVDLESLGINQQTYATLTNEQGGVMDDLIVTRWAEYTFFLIVNAGCKMQDLEHIRSHLPDFDIRYLGEQGLLALQGLHAREIMAELSPEANKLVFMNGCHSTIDGIDCYITRSGYTGEDGFEISVEVDQQSKTGELYKRRAIGKNSAGVTILKGEGSFSAEDQILIDELSFYIVQNNLKAD